MRKEINATVKLSVETEADAAVDQVERLFGHLDDDVYTRIIDIYMRKLWMSRRAESDDAEQD